MYHHGEIFGSYFKGKEAKCKWFNGLSGEPATTVLLDEHSVKLFSKDLLY